MVVPALAATVPADIADEFACLMTHLRTVADPRHRRGRVHPLPGVLGLVVLGLMAGCRSLSAIHRYAEIHPGVLAPLGLRRSPSVPTLSRVLGAVAPADLREALWAFTHELATDQHADLAVVAVDGKTLRGVHEGAQPAHVLHLFAQEAALGLDQTLCATAKGEVTATETWIATVAQQFPGLQVLTADALYAEHDLCAAIVAQDFAYLMRLKQTSPSCWPMSSTSSRSNPPGPMPSR
jgi:hypothetical protein